MELGVGLVCFAVLWFVRGIGPIHDLEKWQRGMVRGWTGIDVAAVAVVLEANEAAVAVALAQVRPLPGEDVRVNVDLQLKV